MTRAIFACGGLPDLHLALRILAPRSYFLNIPRDIEEAAMVDGCSRLKAIFKTQR